MRPASTALVRVERITAAETYDLRRRVLRDGRADADVAFPEDDRPGAFHLGVREPSGLLVAVASFSPEETPLRPGLRAVRMRGMAVDDGRRGGGIGRLLMERARAGLVAAGVEVLWANSRDTALGFYRRMGMDVVGEGFLTDTGIPHHVVLLDL